MNLMMGGPSSQAMIVHFPPCWNLIYSRLPHEMATSSMVCVRCALARLLVLHASSHTSELINMKPGETGFAWRGKAGGVCRTGNRSQGAHHVQVSAAFDCDEHVITNWETIPGAMSHWACLTSPPITPHNPPETRKCHLEVLFK